MDTREPASKRRRLTEPTSALHESRRLRQEVEGNHTTTRNVGGPLRIDEYADGARSVFALVGNGTSGFTTPGETTTTATTAAATATATATRTTNTVEWTSTQSQTQLLCSPSDTADPFRSPLGSWYQDGFTENPGYLASQEELRCMMVTIAQSAAPTRATSPVAETQAELPSAGSLHRAMRQPLSNHRRIRYLKNYVGQVAPWLDMFDAQCTFGMQLPALARTFPALLYAILAISARQIERKEGIQDSFESLELYQEAIRLLGPLLQVRDPKVIAACVLLCVMEMMSALMQDWRRHLEGCAALFDAFGIHGFSNGLLQAVFWCYARMDLCGALMSDGTQNTLLETSKWLAPGYRHEDAARLFHDTQSPDMHANYAVYLGAKACELISNRTKFQELGEDNGCTSDVYLTRWLQLWEDLQNWLANRPSELTPVQTVNTKPFPHILFVHWAAVSSNQLYHTACILLLNMMPKGVKFRPSPEISPLWHARRICGISMTNPHHGCLNNAIQPLWIAGRLFSHGSEHAAIINLMQNIEGTTGWGSRWRIRDLEVAWGYKAHRGDRSETRTESFNPD